jgi:transposase
VDWYEAFADVAGERQKPYVFCMRSMSSGPAFHRAFLRATQQAFLEAHEHAFAYFGGVFRTLRYDNLSAAVKTILRGYQREETARFVAFRSHWRFHAEPNETARKRLRSVVVARRGIAVPRGLRSGFAGNLLRTFFMGFRF